MDPAREPHFQAGLQNRRFSLKIRKSPQCKFTFERQFACQGPPPENVTNFKPFNLGGYWDSDRPPHHSSDVKSCGESISERFTGARALYLSISGRFSKISGFLSKSLLAWTSLKMWLMSSSYPYKQAFYDHSWHYFSRGDCRYL